MRNKLDRFRENAESENVIEPGKAIFETIKGRWHAYFGNDNPIILELGCGKGEYTIGLARLFPEKNYIGVDVKGARIWAGSQTAMEEGFSNVAFLRIRILEIENFVQENEVDEIWITFPDPRPRVRDIKRRLTSTRFLDIYKRLLKPGGWLHLKTDNAPLYEFTLDLLKEREDVATLNYTDDFHRSDFPEKELNILTGYEQRYLEQQKNIKYIKTSFLKE